jgi:hypothetical protein
LTTISFSPWRRPIRNFFSVLLGALPRISSMSISVTSGAGSSFLSAALASPFFGSAFEAGGAGADVCTGSPLSHILNPAGPSICTVAVRARVETIFRAR